MQRGARFAQRYTIEGELGEGGFATVYRARDAHAVVALKVLHRPDAGYGTRLSEVGELFDNG